MNEQDKFKCKHIECDMDGSYCGINKGKGYNHCVLPYYQKSCEYFETIENDIVMLREREHEIAMRHQYDVGFSFGYKQAEKEAAEKIWRKVITLLKIFEVDNIYLVETVYEFAKQAGLEIKE